MKIVVLDARPLNPGDLSWEPLAALGELELHDGSTPDQVADRIRQAGVVFTNKVRLQAAHFAAAPALKLVSVLATGYDVVEVAAARAHGVTVCNVPAYSVDFTAQTTLALLLEQAHQAGRHDAAIRAGEWQRQGTFSFWLSPLVDLAGKRLLIVGAGRIGRRVARLATALGMEVQAAILPGRESVTPADGLVRVPWEEGLRTADVVSLHCPLTPQTHHFMNAARLALLQPHALLVNTARGLLVDEAALVAALEQNNLGGYAADVFSTEPLPQDHPLLRAPRCLLTPHFSWASRECRQRLLDVSVANLQAFLSGHPQNVVS